jgi:eukaryotic-like serine/threonine-protein kinase
MTFCPSDERLVQLLEEQLDRRELVDIELHLERCNQCQEALEELTRERFSFVGWHPWSDLEPTNRRRASRIAPAQLQGLVHTPTQLSAFSAESLVDAIPEVEGYEIFERIGQGGMGVVYRARQHGLERLVALKMIRGGSHAAPEHLARFRIEARALARLGHPNVVQIHDVGRSEGVPFVALELLEGGSLEGRVAGTPQTEKASAELVVTLARAIAAAHRAGVVHRDLKSANVLFAADDTPKIVDFGLAKRLDEEDGQTQTGQVMGSPSFMAPEQAQGREIGPLADVYSLGAILYEMLTGRPPFKGASAMETLFQVVNEEPVPPTRLRPGLSRDLETIALKSLSKEPRRRYHSAEALADDLERYLASTPILARPIGLRERAWKWARRQPALATIALLAVLAAIGLASVAYRGHREEENRSNREKSHANDLWSKGRQVIEEGQLALRDHRYDDGLNRLDKFLPEIAGNPLLSELRDRVKELMALLQDSKEQQNRVDAARDRVLRFRDLRLQALIQDASVGIGEVRDVKGLRQVIRQTLEVFGNDGSKHKLEECGQLPDVLSAQKKDEVEKERYELILILAEAIAQPLPGEDVRQQADQALAILDRAANRSPSNRAYQSYHLIRADCLARKGDASAADRERQAAAAMPTDAFSHLLSGEALQRSRKWVAAIREYETALRLEPSLFRAQILLADCQIQTQQFNEARTHLTACLQREPKAITLLLLRGFASGEEGYQRQKIAQKIAQKSSPQMEGLQKEAEIQFEAAEADFQAAKALNPSPAELYGLLVKWGALRLRRHRLDEAVSDLVKATALRPDEVSAYIVLGQAYRQQGKIDASLAQFTRAIALKPEMAALYRSRALTRLEQDHPSPEAREESLQDLSRAISLVSPGDLEFAADRARRARLLLQLGRPKESLADCEDALRAVPNDSEALLIRVKSLLELKRFNEVVGACDDALSRSRPSGELYELRGLARASRQEYAGAIQDYTQSLAIDPNRPTPLIQRGWAYLVSEAPSLAILDFDQAIRIAPDEPEAYNGRGFARVLCGHHKEAVDDADASIVRGMNDARTLYNAARIYAKAAIVVTSGNTRRNLGQISISDKYQDKAQVLIRMALEKMPAEERGTFWQSVVEADPALASLRQRPKFSQMAGQYGRLSK